MENCLGGSRRVTKAQKDLQQLKQQQQQQPPNQNYYTTHQQPPAASQQPLVHRSKREQQEQALQQQLAGQALPLTLQLQIQNQQQQQQQQQQQKQQQHYQTQGGTSHPLSAVGTSPPKFVAHCMNFPPPPDYPPPHQHGQHSTASLNVKTTPGAVNDAGSHHFGQQQHLQQIIHHQPVKSTGLEHAAETSMSPDHPQPAHQAILHQAHPHHHSSASASSSPSSSSATSATAISVAATAACSGRRTINPRYPDLDPDAIEVCGMDDSVESGVIIRGVGGPKTLGHRHGGGGGGNGGPKWSVVHQASSMQVLHGHPLQQPPHHHHQQHDYSYAYYEPGAAMRHSNIPQPEQDVNAPSGGASAGPAPACGANSPTSPPPPNSIRALLSKGKKNKLLVSPATRQSYQSRYGVGSPRVVPPTLKSSYEVVADGLVSSTGENFYEEISSTDPRHPHQSPPQRTASSQSAGSLSQSLVEEELRRVQTRHRKILGELNLSVEAMLMPESPPSTSPTKRSSPSISVTAASGQPVISDVVGLRLSSSSADNICNATNMPELLNSIGPTDELLSPLQASTVNAAFCGDLDSGFSGSSGASYIGSLRMHKTNVALSQLISSRQHTATGGTNLSAAGSFSYATHSCRSFHRASGKQQRSQCMVNEDSSSSGFLTRASCGRRILNCAKIRAAEDPGPILPTESKARSFWNRKGWRKLPGFSSTSSIDDAGLTDEQKVNSGSWEETALTGSPESGSEKHCSGITTTTTAQLHCAAPPALRHAESLSGTGASASYNGLRPLLIPTAAAAAAAGAPQSTQHHHHHRQQRGQNCGSPSRSSSEAAVSEPQTGHTIAGGSFSTNGGPGSPGGLQAAGVGAPSCCSDSESGCHHHNHHHHQHHNNSGPPLATTSDEEAVTEDEQSSSVTSSLSAPNQRNSQLRSTFHKAKQHLSFDKWRTSLSTGANGSNGSVGSSPDSNGVSNSSQGRRSSTCATMAAAQQQQQTCREDITTPGESPGGRLSRWFSIRRGSSHQYDVGGRDGRQSSQSSMDIPDAVSMSSCHESPQKLSANSSHANKMPGVPENEDDDLASLTSRFDLDMIIPPGSRANGTARSANARLITPALPPAPAGLSQQQLKRRHIVAAIVHSENSYVATLQRLVNDYKKPLEESSPPVLSATKIATLFHRLPEILQSHKLFRIALSECVRNWDRDEKLGDCFVSAFSKPRILEIYSGFINNFSAAMELAKMEEKRKSALADFFKVKQISAHDRLSFFGLMVKPVQRFPQFILFLQDLLKYTPQGHHDRMSLQLALTQLELLAEMLNERKREAEQYQGFKEMLGHISGTFNTRSLTSSDGQRPRYLLREDNVTHMEFNQAGFIVKSKQRRLLLLNDKVICVSVAPKQSHDFGATEKLSFKWMYPVTDVEIVDNSTSATLSRILTAGLNRGGSLKSNCSSGANNFNGTLPLNASPLDHSAAAQLTSGADNLCNEMSTLMYDYEVISRIHDLVGSLKGTYKELNSNTTRNLLNTIQCSIQRKDEEMVWADSCCLQLIARSKSGKEETFTFQTQNPNVKKEWITELRLAQLALDTNNSPAWEASLSEPIHTYEQQQQHQLQQQKQSSKMPLFVKAMPVFKSQHQTEVRCGCYYGIANDGKLSGNARRRHKQQNYLWICTSDGTASHIAIYSQHHQQAGNLREISSISLVELQVTAMEFVKGLDTCKQRDDYHVLLGDLIWMGTDSRKIVIYSAQNPEQEQELSCCSVPGSVMRILYHFDAVYVALSNATMLIYRRSYEGVWQLKEPQVVQLGESGMPVPSLLPINMNIYAACANRVYVLNAFNGEIQKSFEVHHGANQQVNLMAHSGIGLWISLRNSTVLCLYHTETFKHLQDINVASSVLRSDGKKEQAVNSSSIYVTALMACKGLLWVGTNVGIAVTIPLPRLEGVPIISGGISMSCHAHFGPITFLLPLVPKVYPNYKPPPPQAITAAPPLSLEPSPPPSMGEDLQLPAIDDDPKKIAEADLDETSGVILRRDLRREDSGSGTASPSACMLRDLSVEAADSAHSSPRCSKLDKQNSLDQSLGAKIRASLANSPAFHRKRLRDLSMDAARMSKTLPRGVGSANNYFNSGLQSNTSTLNHYEHGYCDVYGLYGKLIFVKEDYDAEEGTQGNLMDMMYEGMRRSDPELAAIPGKVSTLDRRLRMKASRPRSLDLSNWSVDSKSSSLYTSSGSEESMGIRMFGVRSVSRNSSSASHKTSGTGSDLGNISENGLMTIADIHQHSTPKSEDGFKLMFADKHGKMNATAAGGASESAGNGREAAPAAVATLKRKQKQTAKQQQLNSGEGPRTIITLMGGRGYWRHMWYNTSNSPGSGKSATLNSSSSLSGGGGGSGGSGSSSPLIANSNDAHIVVWEKKL